MRQYLELLKHVQTKGVFKPDRTGTGTVSVFGAQMRCDLNDGFPLLTTKKVHFKSVVHELLWFISGSTNIQRLKENDVNIWNEWADEDGNLGRVYGAQWRNFGGGPKGLLIGVDQLQGVIDQIGRNPDSRRLVVTAWDPRDVAGSALPPCHCMFQFFVSNGALSCHMYQRSADIFLGVPFNIASYALLTMMVAQVCNLKLGDFIHSFGDLHIYKNHQDQVSEQLSRSRKRLPSVALNKEIKHIDDFTFDDIKLLDYNPYPAIKGKVAV